METHFVATPIGFAVKDDTLYVITGRKEHDLTKAQEIASSALSLSPDLVTATPPEHVPAMIRVLVLKQASESAAPPKDSSDHFATVQDARNKVKSKLDTVGFNAFFSRGQTPRTAPNTKHPALPKPAGPEGTPPKER